MRSRFHRGSLASFQGVEDVAGPHVEASGDLTHGRAPFKGSIFGYSVEFFEQLRLTGLSDLVVGRRGLQDAGELADRVEDRRVRQDFRQISTDELLVLLRDLAAHGDPSHVAGHLTKQFECLRMRWGASKKTTGWR